MTQLLLPPDVEELLISYLSPLGDVSVEMMNPVQTFPFYLINRISGGDDYVTDCAAVSIHAFHTSRTLASAAARAMHLKMKQLTPQVPVLMSDSTYASVDYVGVIETPNWVDYGDKEIERYVGRYRIEVRCNLTT